jgi:hypothetical protein
VGHRDAKDKGPFRGPRDRARLLPRACGFLGVLARRFGTRVSKGSLLRPFLQAHRGIRNFQKHGRARGLARARARSLYKRPREGPCKSPFRGALKGHARITLTRGLYKRLCERLRAMDRGPCGAPRGLRRVVCVNAARRKCRGIGRRAFRIDSPRLQASHSPRRAEGVLGVWGT